MELLSGVGGVGVGPGLGNNPPMPLHPAPPVLPIAELEILAAMTSPSMAIVVPFAAARVLLSQNVKVGRDGGR